MKKNKTHKEWSTPKLKETEINTQLIVGACEKTSDGCAGPNEQS